MFRRFRLWKGLGPIGLFLLGTQIGAGAVIGIQGGIEIARQMGLVP